MALFRQSDRQHRGLRAHFASASHPGALARPSRDRGSAKAESADPDGTHPTDGRLSELKPGESGVVSSLKCNAQGRLRLMEMGLTPGARVRVVHAAAFGGPLQICVRGYQLSLRRAEASAVVLGDR